MTLLASRRLIGTIPKYTESLSKGLKAAPCRARLATGYALLMALSSRTTLPLTRAQLKRDVRQQETRETS